MAWYDAKLTESYCGTTDANGNPVTECSDPDWEFSCAFKGSLSGRYAWDVGEYEALFQAALFNRDERQTGLHEQQRALLGRLDSYTLTELSAGFGKDCSGRLRRIPHRQRHVAQVDMPGRDGVEIVHAVAPCFGGVDEGLAVGA